MSRADQTKWNARYLEQTVDWRSKPRKLLLDNLQHLPESGWILDIAMGVGTEAGYLSQLGYQVLGIDISSTAVRRAKHNQPQIQAVVGDLMDFWLPGQRFDGILNFYYLQRDLIPHFAHSLKTGGIVIFETLTMDICRVGLEKKREYLLEPQEALSLFREWDILYYREGWIPSKHGNRKSIASVIARK